MICSSVRCRMAGYSCRWSHRLRCMSSMVNFRRTLSEYTDWLAGADTARWRAACDRAGVMYSQAGRWKDKNPFGTGPRYEWTLDVLALITYAVASDQDLDAASVSETLVAGWLSPCRNDADHMAAARAVSDKLAQQLSAAGHTLVTEATRPPEWQDHADPVAGLWEYLIADDAEPRLLEESSCWPDWGQYIYHGTDGVLRMFTAQASRA